MKQLFVYAAIVCSIGISSQALAKTDYCQYSKPNDLLKYICSETPTDMKMTKKISSGIQNIFNSLQMGDASSFITTMGK